MRVSWTIVAVIKKGAATQHLVHTEETPDVSDMVDTERFAETCAKTAMHMLVRATEYEIEQFVLVLGARATVRRFRFVNGKLIES